ncbi:MAG: Ppx/GppA phosphatase family protein [Nocardioides sp.]
MTDITGLGQVRVATDSGGLSAQERGPGPVICAIDCGTNTIKMLIARPGPGGAPEALHRESHMVRLGQGIDTTGAISTEALERAVAAMTQIAAVNERYGVDRVRFCATSATRDADNAAEFAAGVHRILGVEPEVIAGAEEARLAFTGAMANLRVELPAPHLVLDIGGGSTEVILGAAAPEQAHSMNLGSVRHTERHLHSDPPSSAEIAACVADIDAALDDCPVDFGRARSAVGVAGTVLTVASAVIEAPEYSSVYTDQLTVPAARVHEVVDRLLALTVAERRALPFMHPGRADVIGGGALILDRILARTNVSTLTMSGAGILDGIARQLLADAMGTPAEAAEGEPG